MSLTTMIKPINQTLVASATYTADTNSSAVELKLGDSYTIHLKSDAGTGTTPQLDVAMQWTPDDGTTWYFAPIRFAQVGGTASQQEITFRPTLDAHEAAWHSAVGATGGSLAKNFVPSRKVRFVFTVTGTGPSFANVIVSANIQPRG